MPLFHYTSKEYKVGDMTSDGYEVISITESVMVSVLVSNYYARLRGLPESPEVAERCLQLIRPATFFIGEGI